MARDLKLEVVLAAIDKATKPIRAITEGSVGLARQLKATRDTLKGLQGQQKDISSFKALKGASDQTRQAMQASTDRVKALSQELANTSNPTKALSNEFKRAVRESHSLKQKHGEQQRELQGLRGRLGEAGISTKNLGQHERDLRQKLVSTNQALGQQEGRLKRVTEQQNRLTKAKASYEKSQQLAGNMAASGAAGLAAGGGVLYAGARMMAPGIQFDADMAKVQALTRLDGDSEQLAAMRAQARKLGAETMFSATEAAAGQGFLAMAGFNPEAIQKAMPGMLDIAKSGDLGLAETADIVSNVLTGMNMDAADTGRLGDVLVGAFTRSNTNLQMLGETMKYVGPIASSVGQDVETMAAMAGKLGDAGIQGGMGGTALRSIINRLSAPPKAAAKALDQLGISAADADGNMRNLPEVLAEIYQKTKDMGDTDRAGLLKGIAGEEAVSALQVLVKQSGSGDLQEFIQTLRETQGEAERTAKVMGDNLVGDLDELSSAWEDLGIELQTQQNGPLRGIVQTLAGIVGRIGRWAAANPELAGTIVKVVAALAALVAAGGAIAIMLASVIGPIAMVRYGMTLLGIQGGAIIPVIKAVGATVLGLGKALLTTPLGIFVALAVVAAFLLIKHWDKVKAFFAGFVRGLIDGFKGMAYALSQSFKPAAGMLKAVAGALAPVIGWFKALLAPVDSTSEALQRAESAGEKFGRIIGALGVLAGVAVAIKAVGVAMAVAGKLMLINPVVLAIVAIVAAGYLLWRNWDDIIGGLKALWANLVSSARGIWEPVTLFFKGIWSTIKTAFAGGISGMAALIINWSPLGLFYKAFAGVLGWFGVELPGQFTEFGGSLISALVNGIKAMFGGLMGLFDGAWAEIKTAFDGGLLGVSQLIINWSPLGLFYKAFAGVLGWFGVELPSQFTEFGSNLISALVNGIKAMLGGLMDLFNGAWAEIKTAFDGGLLGVSQLIINWSPLGLFYKAFAGVMSYFGTDLPGKFTEFGGMLMSGMVSGITAGLGKVKDAITGAGDQAIGWFKDKLGIRSPSRVFAALGDDTMHGLQAGLDRSQSGPLASLTKATKALVGAGALTLGITAVPAIADQVQPQQPPALTQHLRFVSDVLPAQQPQPLQQQIQQQVHQVLTTTAAPELPELVQRVRVLIDIPAGLADIVAREDIIIDSRPPLTMSGGPVTVQGDTITIQITAQPGSDTADLERMISRMLDERERNKAARIRSSLYDND